MSITVTVEMSLGGSWVDITAYTRVRPGIEIQHGRRSEGSTADASTCTLVLNNADGRFSPRNPAGPYYGQLGRNTPIRVTVGATIRYVGEVSEFPSTWDAGEALIDVPIRASGVLRRLVKNASTASLTRDWWVKRATTSGAIVGYWPIEDGPNTTGFASAIDGAPMTPGAPFAFAGANPSGGTTPPVPAAYTPAGYTSDPVATFKDATATGAVQAVASTGGLSFGGLIHIPEDTISSATDLITMENTGTAFRWSIRWDDINHSIRVSAYAYIANVYTTILNTVPVAGNFTPGSTYYVYLELANNGANIDWYLTVLGSSSGGGTLNSYQVGAATNISVGAPVFPPDDEIAVGHVAVGSTATAFQQTGNTLESALLGYTSAPGFTNSTAETVTERLQRLADTAGVDITLADGSYSQETMGVEQAGGILDRMRAAEAADVGGILSDDITTLGLRYATRTALYSDTATATTPPVIDYSTGQLIPPLEPTDDDQNLRNDITVTVDGGSTGRAVQETGPLNVQAYPDGVGRYEDTRTLSLAYTADPAMVASWLLGLGTVDETRYPQITIDLVAQTALVTDIEALRPGSWVTLTGLPAWLPPGDVDLVVLGWTERIGSHTRTVTLNCAPAAPYRVFVLDDSSFGRLDSTTTTTNEALDTTETGIDYTGDTLVTTAGNPSAFPYDIVIGGEQMTVTSATGTTLTVTRSVNGVVKSHASGVPIALHRPVRLAL